MDLTERDHPGWTMADAERLDRTHLEIACRCGRVMQYPWRLLPSIPPHVPVASLAGRLVCNACADVRVTFFARNSYCYNIRLLAGAARED